MILDLGSFTNNTKRRRHHNAIQHQTHNRSATGSNRELTQLSPVGAKIRNERTETLKGQVRDYNAQAFEDAFTAVTSGLRGLADGLRTRFDDEDWSSSPAVIGNYYFNLMNIVDQIDRIERMVDGYDEFVSRKHAVAMGIDDYIPALGESNIEALA